MVRSPCCEKSSVKRGVWSAEEDAKILAFVSKHGSGNWTSVPKKAGLKRCGKSCRLRWTNYLRPDLKHDNFTPQEEDLIVKLHAAIGSRWSIIAQQLPGRTDNDVKNYWNTKLKKKLSQMGIDPVTHKPFSKLIADYGNIGGCQKQSSRIGSVHNKDLKNAIMLNSVPYQTLPQEIRSINSQPKESPTSPLKMEPTENNVLFNRNNNDNNNNNNNNNNPSMDLAQLQGMPIVANASKHIDIENETIPIPSSILGEVCLSTTSSPCTSSNCSTTAQEASPVSFSWNDFLLEDAFAPPADNHEKGMVGGFMSKDLVSHIENVTRQSWNKKEIRSQQATSNEFMFPSSSSSSDISFVEAMLDQENEMFLSFPHLMEEPPNY